jgi:hypothetical protein
MDANMKELSPQLKAIKKTDLSFFVRMGGMMAPKMIDAFLPCLDEKQKAAFNKVMPVGGTKKIFMQLVGTPTPPIVVEIGQPLKMDLMAESEVKAQKIKGIRLNIEDLQALMERRIFKLLWQLKGQLGTLLSLSGLAMPLIQLGPRELKDLQNKAMTHFKPVLDMMPH